jgi:D-alanine-D-alanine ligase
MKVAIVYNKDLSGVINIFGMQNKEVYKPETVRRVASSLEKYGHNVQVIDGNINVIEKIQNFMPRVVEGEKPGMVFNMAYGIQGESRYTHIPSLLEMLGIPYIGSSPSGHALALDKVITKVIMEKNHLPTPRFWVFSSAEENMSEVDFPVIVKPKMESVSFGLKVVNNKEELKVAVDFVINEFNQQALVEQFIKGREFCVGLLGNDPLEAFPLLEIDLGGDPYGIQTVDDKTQKPKGKICPAHVSEELAEKMISLSKKAFKSLQLRDFARVDLRMDEQGNIYLLEINSMASLGSRGSYVYAAAKHGYNFDQLVNRMLDVATVRYFSDLNPYTPNGKTDKTALKTRIRTYIRSRQANSEALLEKITNINTYVRNVEGVNQVGSLITKHLSQIGFKSMVIPQVEIGNVMFFTNCENDDHDILLLGNLDIDTRISKQQSFRRDDLRIYGSGVWESKGGLISMLLALQSLRFLKALRKLKIGILLTTDDSLQGRITRQLILEKSRSPHTVIGLHGGSLDAGMVVSRSGAAVFNCNMKMKETHSAGRVAETISSFSNFIRSICELSNEEEGLVVAPSEMKIQSNITEPYAMGEATVSARYNTSDQLERIRELIQKIQNKKKFKSLFTLQIEGGERRPPMITNKHSEIFWDEIKGIASDLDIRVLKEHRWSSADICFINNDTKLIDGFGPNGTKETENNEYIMVHSLLEKATLLAMTLYQSIR